MLFHPSFVELKVGEEELFCKFMEQNLIDPKRESQSYINGFISLSFVPVFVGRERTCSRSRELLCASSSRFFDFKKIHAQYSAYNSKSSRKTSETFNDEREKPMPRSKTELFASEYTR